MDARGLVEMLRRTAVGEVRDDSGTRELYATDASLYRRLPVAALRAREVGDLEAAVSACREHGIPLTMRGAGTSLAGQTVGPGLIVDCTSLTGVSIDADAMTARVEPGVVLDQLNRAAFGRGLVFGPDVATANRATLGGMIANNSAGARSITYGLTADHVVALDVVTADGTRAHVLKGGAPNDTFDRCRRLGDGFAPPALLRRVSGYNLDALTGGSPDWPRLLCGSEGTLAVTLGATLSLVRRPQARGLAVVGFPTVDQALEGVVDLLPTSPSAVELLDRAMVDPRNRAPATAQLVAFAGDAQAMLVVEYQGSTEEVAEQLACMQGALTITDPAEQAAVWAARRSGIARAMGLGAGDEKPLAFIEDPAVPPEQLADFARGVRAVLDREGMNAIWYGHASVGCLHIRPMVDLRAPGAVAAMRRVAESVADLVVAHDGSLSGEHGDGRLRGELLPKMYPPAAIAAFAALKQTLDPDRLLNPGVIVAPEPLDANLRIASSPPLRTHTTALSFATEGGLARAAEACTNNGACRTSDGAMCPSFQALGDERHSTRGRAVLFRAAMEGRLEGDLANDELHEALDLCLGCKACKSECPAQVDMSRMKIEALAHRHRERGVPLSARAFGHTHTLLRLGSQAPALARLAANLVGRRLGRRLPSPGREWQPVTARTGGEPVVLVADTFTRFLNPAIGDAAIRVLEAAGAEVTVVNPGCCGRPLLSQGLLAAARRRLLRALDVLAPPAGQGVPILFLEPSCWSMLADDARIMVEDPRCATIAEAAMPIEAWLADRTLPLMATAPATAVVQTHCHVNGTRSEASSLRVLGQISGLATRSSSAGCCGMAGAFGYRHAELSHAIADLHPWNEIDATRVVASGTSCRSQLSELYGLDPRHPVELLAAALPER
jgi:FAD/FMN-containing dehydrogenase/Fe-S oxidoreductase